MNYFQYTELFSIPNTLWSQGGRYTEVLLYQYFTAASMTSEDVCHWVGGGCSHVLIHAPQECKQLKDAWSQNIHSVEVMLIPQLKTSDYTK